MNTRLTPLHSGFTFLKLLLSRRIHFPRDRIGEAIVLDDGLTWRVFRQVIVDPVSSQPQKSGAVFLPRFRVANMNHTQNKLFSLLPVPFFVGLPGFRSKLWLYNHETGDHSGYYEWDTLEDAENYSRSFAVRFMKRRTVPGSVSFLVRPVYPPSDGLSLF